MVVTVAPQSASAQKAKSDAAKKKKGGTPSPEALAAAAELLAQGGYNVTTATGGGVTGLSRGTDPTTGKPIVKTVITSAQGESYFKNLDPKDRSALQTEMSGLKLYPTGYRPSEFVTKEDLAAIDKLVYVADQRGIGNINEVIKLAKKDKSVRSFLQTGGYAPGGIASVTDSVTAKSTLTSKFLDLFNEKPTPEEIKQYQTALNSRERATKGALGSTERDDIILAIANKRVSAAAAKATSGQAWAQDALDSGQLGKIVRSIRNTYADNGIPVDEKTVYKKAAEAMRSDTAYDNVVQSINESAALQWTPLASQIAKGYTVKDILTPFIGLKSKVTGIPQEQINVGDMTDVMNTDGTLKTYSQYKSDMFKSDAYLKSENFKTVKMNDNKSFLRNFGVL